MQRRPTIVAVCCVALCIGVVSFWRASEGPSAQAVAKIENEIGQPLDANAPLKVDTLAMRSVMRGQTAALALQAASAEKLTAALADAINAYGSPQPDAFMAWMDAQGLKKPDGFDSPEKAIETWTTNRRGLRGAKLDFSKCTVSFRVRGGQLLPPTGGPAPGLVGIERSRPDRGAGDVDAVKDHTDSIEISIPGEFLPADGKPCAGQFCLTFVRRSTDGQWIIAATAFRKMPAGKAVSGPPPV